jgi:hypothetical protein
MSKISSAQLKSYIDNIDHHEIYKLHMAQARQTRKMFANDPAVLAKIDVIEAKIKQTYQDACAAQQSVV